MTSASKLVNPVGRKLNISTNIGSSIVAHADGHSSGHINRQIIKLIGQSPAPTILGLLPVEIEMQDACLKDVRDYVAGDYRRLKLNFGYFPAATAFAVAVSIGRGVTDANFYNAIRDQLGLELSNNERNSLANHFALVCKKLGVVMPPDVDDAHMDKNLRQIIFQAGILPYWVEHLGPAVTSYLERNACPDLEDEVQVARFAKMLAEKVPEGHARLRRTLNSRVGPLVTGAILRSFSSGDFEQLPPHLRVSMREARRKTGAESIRSPFLRYRRESGELVVVLPRQNARLADYNSHWLIGTNTHNALIERELDAIDLGAESISIQLRSLRPPFQDQTFSVKLAPDAKEPFFVFRATDGRRLFMGDRVEMDLPLGDYDLLLSDAVLTQGDEVFEKIGKHRSARVEVFPGRDALILTTGEREFSLRPRLGADLLIQDRAGNRLGTFEGGSIYYGDTIEIHAFTPMMPDQEVEPVEFKIECLESEGVPSKIYRAEQPSQRGAYEFYDLTEALARPFFLSLPAGVFEVQISAEQTTRTFNRKLTYWKGFQNSSFKYGFQCTAAPRNYDAGTSSGLISTSGGLKLNPDHIGAEVVLGVKQPSRVFTLAKPGLWLSLSDIDQHEVRPLRLGCSVEVIPATRQSLIVESGDVLPWQITCQGTVIVTLKPGQPKSALNLSALLAQFGETGRLQATNQAGTPVDLVTFSKANLIRDLKVNCPAGAFVYDASFKLGQSQVTQLEITVVNFADATATPVRHEIDLMIGTIPVQGLGDGAAVWQISTEESDWVIKLNAKLTEIPGGIHFVDFRGRRNPDDAWQSLRVADLHGLSESRLVLVGPPLAQATVPWTRLVTSVCGAFNKGSGLNLNWLAFSESEMADTLSRLQEALLFKYASAIWPGVMWLENAVSAVCQNCYDGSNQKAFALAAVAGLERRSESGLNINSILIFGCQSKLLSIKGDLFGSISAPKSVISKVFMEMGKVSAAASLKDYAWTGGQLDYDFLCRFGNFPAVAGNQAKEFSGFKYQDYFKHLGTVIQDLDFRHANTPVNLLLSPAHFLDVIRPLNRRFRPLEQVRTLDQPASALSQMVGEIQAAKGQFDRVAMSLKEKLSIPGHVDFWVPISIAESEMVQAVSDILFLIAGMARMNSANLLTRAQYKELLKTLIFPDHNYLERRIRRICLLLSLAPELFAFYMLFWEAVLKPQAKHERN